MLWFVLQVKTAGILSVQRRELVCLYCWPRGHFGPTGRHDLWPTCLEGST